MECDNPFTVSPAEDRTGSKAVGYQRVGMICNGMATLVFDKVRLIKS